MSQDRGAEVPVCDRHGRPVVMIHQFDYSDGVMTPLDRFVCGVCTDPLRGPDWGFDAD